MTGTMQTQIAASVADARERPADTDSPCVYYSPGPECCTCDRRPSCPYWTTAGCVVAGRVGAVGQRQYKGQPPEAMSEEVDA